MSSPMSAPSRKRKPPQLRREEGWVIAVPKWWDRSPVGDLIIMMDTYAYSRKEAQEKFKTEHIEYSHRVSLDDPELATWAGITKKLGAVAVRVSVKPLKR